MAFFEDKETEEVNNTLWTEHYRPRVLKDYVGNEHLKTKVADYLESGDVPHLLFYGKAGTGKTTLAKLIVNSIDCDHIIINASDENNVDTVRTKVKGFASTIGFRNSKIVILDEFDYMTPNAQAILRNLMETFSKHCRFILTCNYVEKVIDPIQSRCQTFQIVPPTKKDVAVQISQILGKENVKFELKDLVPIIDASYPDIRKIINTCQLNSSKGILKVDVSNILSSDIKIKVVDLLKGNDDKRNKYMKIRQAVADSRIQDFSELYGYLYEKIDEYAGDNTSNVILTLSEGQYKDSMVVDKEITFMATIIQIVGLLS
jgi:DNA polymerase III delta prime subunit|tara:strand:+ start:1129 stop:2079 length:951 start_codon:yes stop_codon:yes gene_type:complete